MRADERAPVCLQYLRSASQHGGEFRTHSRIRGVWNRRRRQRRPGARADGMQARYALILGPDELSAGQVGIRNLATREQIAVPIDEVVGWLGERANSAQAPRP